MNHDILADKLRKAFGPTVPFAARESWSLFLRERRTEFTFRYEWIRDPRFYYWLGVNKGELDIHDGVEMVKVYLCKPDGEPLNQY